MPTITYDGTETAALAHYAAQTSYGSAPVGAPTSSLLRAVEEIRPLATILAKHKAGIEASFDESTSRAINTVVAGPASGSAGPVVVRALVAADIPTLNLAKISDAGTAAARNVGSSSGNLVELGVDGKVSTAYLPALAITSTQVAANEAAMLALTAEPGDLAVRTDLNKTFILVTAPASVLGNWQELLTPTDLVSSVAGKTGAVTLDAADINTALAYTAANAAALNASNLTAGTIPDARFPAVLPAVSGANLTNLPGVSGIVSDAATNTVSDALVIQHATSGTAAAGFGTGLLFRGENAAGTMRDMAQIQAVYTDAGDGSENAALTFRGVANGTFYDIFTFDPFEVSTNGPALTFSNAVVGPARIRSAASQNLHVLAGADLMFGQAGVAFRWSIPQTTGHFVPDSDITYDVGTPTARVKDVHASSVKTYGRSYLATPASAPTDGDIANGAFSAYLDEAGAALKFRVRYSDGTLKTGSVALT